jgi:hypothetical protein
MLKSPATPANSAATPRIRAITPMTTSNPPSPSQDITASALPRPSKSYRLNSTTGLEREGSPSSAPTLATSKLGATVDTTSRCDRYGLPVPSVSVGLRSSASRKCGCQFWATAARTEEGWILHRHTDPASHTHSQGQSIHASAHPPSQHIPITGTKQDERGRAEAKPSSPRCPPSLVYGVTSPRRGCLPPDQGPQNGSAQR